MKNILNAVEKFLGNIESLNPNERSELRIIFENGEYRIEYRDYATFPIVAEFSGSSLIELDELMK